MSNESIGYEHGEIYDAIFDRPEPVDLYALVQQLTDRVEKLEAMVYPIRWTVKGPAE